AGYRDTKMAGGQSGRRTLRSGEPDLLARSRSVALGAESHAERPHIRRLRYFLPAAADRPCRPGRGRIAKRGGAMHSSLELGRQAAVRLTEIGRASCRERVSVVV